MRTRKVTPLYHIQVWDAETRLWETVDRSDCKCFIGRKCDPSFCAIRIAKDYEELEGHGAVRIAHSFIGQPTSSVGMVLWPLGMVRHNDIVPFMVLRKHHRNDSHAKTFDKYPPYVCTALEGAQ